MTYSGLLLRCFRGHFVLGVCLASLMVVLATDSSVAAQQGKYVTQASARLTKLIDAANADGYKLHDNSFSIGGGWLKQGNDNWVGLFTVQLKSGKEYRFLAAGDADARDVDLQVTDSVNVKKVFVSDTSTNPAAIVNFTPEVSGRYLVRIRLYASENDLPCVCLGIVMSK